MARQEEGRLCERDYLLFELGKKVCEMKKQCNSSCRQLAQYSSSSTTTTSTSTSAGVSSLVRKREKGSKETGRYWGYWGGIYLQECMYLLPFSPTVFLSCPVGRL